MSYYIASACSRWWLIDSRTVAFELVLLRSVPVAVLLEALDLLVVRLLVLRLLQLALQFHLLAMHALLSSFHLFI